MSDKETVDKLLGVFKKLKGEKGGGKKGWLIGGIAGGIALIIIGILTWRAFRQGKKLAKLLHEKAVAEEKEIQAVANAKIAESEEKRLEAAKKVEEIRQKIITINESMEEAVSIRDQAKETINEIKTWDDFDKHVGS